MRQELRSAVVAPAFFVLLWNSHGAGTLYLRPTRSRTRVAQKGRLLPQRAPFPFSDGFSHLKARNPLRLTFALKLAPAFPLAPDMSTDSTLTQWRDLEPHGRS
jgi:hypothetical protein